jgi:beta-galactosidase
LQAASAVNQVVKENHDFFSKAQPLIAPIHILYTRESLWVEKRLQRGGTHFEGREIGGAMKSALGYFETLVELGLPPHLGEIREFDFSGNNYAGKTIILAHQVSIPSRYWSKLENFVQRGGKLIVDGLTAYYDENAHCVMKTGFPLAKLFGAQVKEYKLIGDLFDVQLQNPKLRLPGHCWQGTLVCDLAEPVGYAGDTVIAARHTVGAGEVFWLPTLVGLGGRLAGKGALAALLANELPEVLQTCPFRYHQHAPGVLMRVLKGERDYGVIWINKNLQPAEISFNGLPDAQFDVLFGREGPNILTGDTLHLQPEETVVLKFSQ